MPLKSVWLNIPCKDVNASKEFFLKFGFDLNTQCPSSDKMVGLKVGSSKFVVMLVDASTFTGFSTAGVSDTSAGSEMLISMDCDTREEVDNYAAAAKAAGAQIFHEPAEKDGWMYGFAFSDLDGHRWNLLHMDFAKMGGASCGGEK